MKPAPNAKAWAGLNVVTVQSSTYPNGLVNSARVGGEVTKMQCSSKSFLLIK
jgi:hypothetical protein